MHTEYVPSKFARLIGVSAELWIVRHCPTEWSRSGRHTSVTDLPLLPDAEEDARALAPRLAAVGPALVLTSPRERARRTAALGGFADAVVDEDLVEWAYGDYEGLTTPHRRLDGNPQHLLEFALTDVIVETTRPKAVFLRRA